MGRKLKIVAAMLVVAMVTTACYTAAGSMVGAGIGKASGGDGTTGALIGGGIGMMVDLHR